MTRPSELPDFPASQLFLRRLAYHLVHDEARAEDLVQDTWAAWVEHKPRGVAEPRAWLARVLRNRALNLKRGDERRTRREQLAGRPDPSAPETDGTLEAQAQLIAVLRELEEPYRSTLVQRYYHDLAPKEIAERAGTPLNTVKARLARGLEKLRAAMDARYRGDRRAWCHWLTILGAPPVPIAVPPPHAPLTGVGGTPSALAWVGVVVAVAAAAVWRAARTQAPASGEPRTEERSKAMRLLETPPGERRGRSVTRDEAPRETTESPALPRKELTAATEPAAPAPTAEYVPRGSGGSETFDWPQYGGGPEHDNLRAREDEITAPEVSWFVPGCTGQPTLRGGMLYTGGITVGRIDAETGEVEGVAMTLLLDAFGIAADQLELDADGDAVGLAQAAIDRLNELAPQFEEHGLDRSAVTDTVAAAPVITSSLVLVRRVKDGGVTAFDRELEKEVWSWEAPDKKRASVPLCLASEELLLVASDNDLVALRVSDGEQVWRAWVVRLEMVPASDGRRVYFGDWGTFRALDLATGREVWSSEAEGYSFGWTAPVVIGTRVIAADRGKYPAWQSPSSSELETDSGMVEHGRLSAFGVDDGKLLWRKTFDGFGASTPGVGARGEEVFVGYGEEVAPFSVASGTPDFTHAVKTGRHPFGSPTVVGKSLVFGDMDGHLYVYDLERGELKWSFHAPQGAQVHDFVHTGTRIYVATTIGLFCIGNDPKAATAPPGTVLEWSESTGLPSSYGK